MKRKDWNIDIIIENIRKQVERLSLDTNFFL